MILTKLMSTGRMQMTRKEKNQDMKTETVVNILCSAQLLYRYIKRLENIKVTTISPIIGQKDILTVA